MNRVFRKFLIILISFLVMIPAASANVKYGIVNADTDDESEDLAETITIQEFTICPVGEDGIADLDNPLADMPETFHFVMGTEYVLVFRFAELVSNQAYENLQKVIEDSGILSTGRGAATAGGAAIYVTGAETGSATLEFTDNYSLNAVVEEDSSEELAETITIQEFTICPVGEDGIADLDNPLADMPETFHFVMGTEYVLVFRFAELVSYEAYENLKKVIEDSGILTVDHDAATAGGAAIYVMGAGTGSATLAFTDNYSLDAFVDAEPAWKSNSNGWWYDRGDGTYPADEFEEINGNTYYFNSSGYMVTGWQAVNANWYFFNSSGAMKTNAWEGDYYLLADGKMARNQWIDGRYYVGSDGKWIPAHWENTSSGWWYNRGDGSFPANQFEVIGSQTYYFDNRGYMVTGWRSINGSWYFFSSSGAMKKNAWEGDYYLLSDGKMARNQWIGGKYYVGSDGKWIKDYGVPHWESNSTGWWYNDGYGNYPKSTFRTINGATYYFNASGYMVTGWQAINGSWYFFNSSGAMKKNAWEGDYYLGSNGVMATNTWIGHYYVDNSGKSIDHPYCASRNSEVFHRFNCGEAARIKASNLIQFSTYEDASKGRRPCSVCNP